MFCKMSDAVYDLYIKYHLATCERQDMIGCSHHTLAIFHKELIRFDVDFKNSFCGCAFCNRFLRPFLPTLCWSRAGLVQNTKRKEPGSEEAKTSESGSSRAFGRTTFTWSNETTPCNNHRAPGSITHQGQPTNAAALFQFHPVTDICAPASYSGGSFRQSVPGTSVLLPEQSNGRKSEI